MRPCVSNTAHELQKRDNYTHDRHVSCSGRRSNGVRTQQRAEPSAIQSCKHCGVRTHAVAATPQPSSTSAPLPPCTVRTGGVATLVHAPSAGRHRLEGGACGTGLAAWKSAGKRKHHTARHDERCPGSGWRMRWAAALTFGSTTSARDEVVVVTLIFLSFIQLCSVRLGVAAVAPANTSRNTELRRAAEF